MTADWRMSAACRDADPEIFFVIAPAGTEAAQREAGRALAVCRPCPVRVPCLRFAVGTRQADGIWGGTTEGERKSALPSLTRGAA